MSAAPRPLDVSQSGDPTLQAAYRFFCRHLVCLAGWVEDLDARGQPTGRTTPFAFSAFVLVIRGEWHLLTAGHILKGVDERLARKEIRMRSSYMLAGFGPEVTAHRVAHEPIHFDYEGTPKTYLDQDGLDFGLVDLGNYLRAHLELNGVEPVREGNWQIPVGLTFDWCVMLGFPQEFVDVGEIAPTMLHVTQLDELPDGVEPTEWLRFVGKLSDRFSLKSLVGMSGGPIYGFDRKRPDRYWIAAIQSGWLKDRKITFACPVPLLARLADAFLYGDDQPSQTQ